MCDHFLNDKFPSADNYSFVHPDFSSLIEAQDFIQLNAIEDLLDSEYVLQIY